MSFDFANIPYMKQNKFVHGLKGMMPVENFIMRNASIDGLFKRTPSQNPNLFHEPGQNPVSQRTRTRGQVTVGKQAETDKFLS